MLVCIQQVLGADDVVAARAALEGRRFEDGRRTAGWHAKLVKRNDQAERDSAVDKLEVRIRERLESNAVFRLAARPRKFSPLLFSRYEPGMEYGTHVDDALTGDVRTDVSFTVFLSDPAHYDGGELVVETTAGEQSIKLAAGDAVMYPSTTLHRVEPITRGIRLAAVGWVQSVVRRADERELLFDLETARRLLFEREGKSREFDLLSKCSANLLRLWAEA